MANEIMVQSNAIKVFPTTKRSDEVDRNARLMSEQNLISIVNRLTGLKSFIINIPPEITINASSITIPTNSEFNIGGYYFKFIQPQIITFDNNIKEIGLQITTATSGDFTELQGNDPDGTKGNYSGLKIITSATPGNVSSEYLPIIRKYGSNWAIINDSKLNIVDENMLVTSDLWNRLSDHNSDNSLKSFLTNIDKLVIIDDGDLDS